MKNPIHIELDGAVGETASRGLLRRALNRLRLPMRGGAELAQAAEVNRAQRIFEVNFRSSSWTR